MTTAEPPGGTVFVFFDKHGRLSDRARLQGLRDVGIAGGARSESLDRIARLAAGATEAAVSLLSFVYSERQTFPGAYGLPDELDAARETPLSRSLCHFVVVNDAPLVISDVRAHAELRRHLPGLSPDVAAYAGYPLHDPYGNALGALCVVDASPHDWDSMQLAVLEDLAATAESEIALRLRTREALVVRGRLRQTIEAAASTAIVAADSEGVIVLADHGAEVLFGRRADDLVGKELITGLQEPGSVERAALAGSSEWHIADAEGARRVVSVRHSVVLDDEGQVDGFLLVGEDMTARRAVDEELRKARKNRREALNGLVVLNRAKNDFVGTASHELRTPLTSLIGYTELLLDGAGGALTPSQVRLVQPIERNSKRLLCLVEDLIVLSQIQAGTINLKPRPVPLGEIAARAWDALQPDLDRRALDARVRTAAGLHPVLADSPNPERALLHLLANAVKFTPDGGKVRLRARSYGDELEIEVSDTGIGIPQDELATLFAPFARGREAQDQAFPGFGVGLAVVKGLVDAHGGRVSVRSKPGRGTTVTVRLPATRGADEDQSQNA
jgi:hypothetical protein